MLDATAGANDSAQTVGGNHGLTGHSRRPRPKTKSPVAMNASAPGSRAAHSWWPSNAKLAASAQYVSGGLVRCGCSPSTVGTSQSPFSCMWMPAEL